MPTKAPLIPKRRKAKRLGKPNEPRFYDLRNWRDRVKPMMLEKYPICYDCEDSGYFTESVEVHHIKKVKDFPKLAFCESNLLTLCHSCHSKRTARGE